MDQLEFIQMMDQNLVLPMDEIIKLGSDAALHVFEVLDSLLSRHFSSCGKVTVWMVNGLMLTKNFFLKNVIW